MKASSPALSALLRRMVLALSAGTIVTMTSAAPATAQIVSAVQRAAARTAAKQAAQQAARRQAPRVASQQMAKVAAGGGAGKWTTALCKPSRPCPLPEQIGGSFRGGSYSGAQLRKDTRLYRAYTDPANRIGAPGARYSFWSRDPAIGHKAVIDRAIPVSTNGNIANRSVTIKVPRGTTIYEGKAAGLRRGPVGGGNQVVIDRAKRAWVE